MTASNKPNNSIVAMEVGVDNDVAIPSAEPGRLFRKAAIARYLEREL